MRKTDAIVVKHVLLAQWASTMAKIEYYDRREYYGIKDKAIKKAISILKNSKHSGVQFKIENKPDQNGYPSRIYYFEFYIKGEKYQFSFHKPYGDEKPCGNQKIVWDRKIGGCISSYLKVKGCIGYTNTAFDDTEDCVINKKFKKWLKELG